MKKLFFICFLLSGICFSQNNYIVKTEDGRRVLLKSDYTWEYIDADVSLKTQTKQVNKTNVSNCVLGPDYKEPKLNSSIQSKLKRGKSSMPYIKEKVAKDKGCSINNVYLLSLSESQKKGVYYFCVNGEEVRYKRIGNKIMKARKLF